MPVSLGVVLALVALVAWGIGDFLLQRSARRFGSWESICSMSLIASAILLPFAAPRALTIHVSSTELVILLVLSFCFFGGVFLGVEALRRGKLSIVESVGVIEIPIMGVLSYILLDENLDVFQWALVGLLLFGVSLVALRAHALHRLSWLEPGALLSMLAGILFGFTGFLVGSMARTTDPVVTVWGFNMVMAVISLSYLISVGRFTHFVRDFKNNKNIMLGVGFLDSVAWLSYALSATYVPIVIAGVLSEGYIVLATLLGVFLNRERLFGRQVLGMMVAIAAATLLSSMY